MPVSTIKLLENLIDYCAVKNKVISKNIANIGTEDYRREDVKFKSILDDSMNSSLKATNEKHFGTDANKDVLNYQVEIDNSTDKISGANNVDIDKEMSDLAENSMRFKFASKRINFYYKNLQNVIKGGGSV
ncbi:MAG: flagellar basal body rod protein FlgB [Bacteroidota bacterium]|nr:flagellar basal body rod protein FlgB [Bacteroidota bacterium]